MLRWLLGRLVKNSIWIEVSIGEAVDRLTILEIKCSKLNGEKRAFAKKERNLLQQSLKACGIRARELKYYHELFSINNDLWVIEDKIRQVCEKGDCLDECINLARKVYQMNDRRSGFKRAINLELGSKLQEVKLYKGK